jgi:surface antigen
LRPPVAQSVLQPLYRLNLYRAWGGVGLSAISPAGAVMTLILIGVSSGGCSMSRSEGAFSKESAFAKMGDSDVTGSISATPVSAVVATPTETDLAFARNAASDVLTKGDKDSSQPWENPETGARGSVTPLAKAYASEGRTCRDFLASYVNGRAETWLQGAACQSSQGRWEIHTLKPWRQG